jgi:hypothetical protein
MRKFQDPKRDIKDFFLGNHFYILSDGFKNSGENYGRRIL